jgi:predicted membrane protein
MIVLGVSKIFSGWSVTGRVWGAVIALIGALFLLRNLGLVHVIVWHYFWPMILILVGIGMLLRGLDRDHPWHWDWQSHLQDAARAGAAKVQSASNAKYSENFVKIDAIFSGVDRRIDSQDFAGGEIVALFGGVDLDLSRAATTKEEIRIEANAVFGGIEIRVPDTWRVVMHGPGVFGGFSDQTHPPPRTDAKPPVLIVTGSAVFGGVDVTN